jgi:Mg-chelatase subunit ChlD
VLDGDGGADGEAASDRPPVGPGARQRWMTTTEAGERRTLEEVADTSGDGAAVRAMAAAIARRLSVRPRRRDSLATRGSGPLFSVPYRYGSDEIDLDRTLEVLTERPVPEDTDIIVRERMRGGQAVVLMVDVSGSMRGEKVRIAAATVAALARDLVHDELAVVAFWRDAVLVKPMGPVAGGAAPVLDGLLRIPAKGLTNVEFALGTGLAELTRARSRRRRGILLSDAVHNAGPDPRPVAARFPRLDVLLETDGEHDAELASELAGRGRGEVRAVADHRAVAPALNRIFAR